jgi:hypothetical protein
MEFICAKWVKTPMVSAMTRLWPQLEFDYLKTLGNLSSVCDRSYQADIYLIATCFGSECAAIMPNPREQVRACYPPCLIEAGAFSGRF